ncbi:ComEC family competence protein [Sphingomonas psychrotolerans]|uniref:ComEC family competence protein n=1 Tax=Sphingomonas psychrotolerans TaxID=1327635 RepID=A0ABU3N321_9SPHN|nr:ComEC/Rec2 family competence protein [Sphingomonas psychrotolerans]MDT8757625.1 ComEC family competence protein [Sphingomonas psychrotolerans]
MGVRERLRQCNCRIEAWFEAEREQLVLWLPVLLGGGITAWFLLPDASRWLGFIFGGLALGLVAAALPGGGRAPRALAIAGATLAAGCALIWWRSERVAAPVLARPAVVLVTARVERVEQLPARELTRVTLAPIGHADLPPRIRLNLERVDAGVGIARGAVIRLRARLMPPPSAAVPGAYDFARVAWFAGLGATGKGFAPVKILQPGAATGADLRARLSAHIQSRIAGSGGGIASALATGDQGAIAEADSDAMRRSGLAHLLSVSGLHVTAVTAAAMLLVLRLLALSPTLALRWRLPLIAAGAGALAAVGYTLLTGAEVPTIRSCVAALLVLLALTLGREAITLRLVAAGAVLVLLLWPEALAGPSFQLSFAAVTAIVALHESPKVRGWFKPREEGRGRRLLRGLGSLLLTGVAVELALMPIGLFHFHKAGIYGALANIIAIPLTTFVIMPLEALALTLDLAGIGAPVWWLTARALDLLLWLAHTTASAPGAVAALPVMPGGAYALIVPGALWVALWRTQARWAGALPFTLGIGWALLTPPPDLLVTGDGRHLAIRMEDGEMALLRDRPGDYTRSTLGENSGAEEAELSLLSDAPGARCSPDLCLVEVPAGGRRWRILATRSAYLVPWSEMLGACRTADIVVSERRLPPGCTPRWLKLDREALAKTGGVAINFANTEVRTVRGGGSHPWLNPLTVQPPFTAPRTNERRSRP